MPPEFDRLILEEIFDGIIAKSSEGRVLYWNRGAERVFGFTAQEAVGQLVSELIIPPDRLEEEASILKDVLVRELSQYETTRRCKDGALIYVDVSSKAVRDEAGQLQFILSSNKDVTQLKVARDASMAEARFGSLMESMADGIVMANSAGRVVLANSQAEKMFDYKKGEIVGKLVESLMPERFRRRHTGHRGEFLGQPRQRFMGGAGAELCGVRGDGTEFPAEIMLSPVRTEQGLLIVSAVRDISDRRKAEQRYREQAQIIDLVNDAVFQRDLEDRITYWNKGAERAYGWSAPEVLGKVSHELLRTVFPEPLEKIRSQLLTDGHWEGELVHSCRDGGKITVSSRWSLRRDVRDQPAEIIELNYDITNQKHFERVLQVKNAELEMAAASKNRFLANMSHELRTPLNGIIGFAEFLIDGKPGSLNPKQKEYLGDILQSGRHLLQLINDLLDLSKVEANRMELRLDTFLLPEAIEGVCSVARPIAQKRNITIEISLAPGLHEVTLDPQKFKQVLYNLLSNAIKFTEEGGRIEIRAAPYGEGHFTLAVTDTGIGIRKEDFGRLFKEFEQIDSGAARHYEGTGLGLALTRRMVELQGGRISFKSEVGKGTVFTVALPIRGGKT